MCASTPSIQPAPAPPETKMYESEAAVSANRAAEARRRRIALSRMDTQSGGAMQGPDAGKLKMGV